MPKNLRNFWLEANIDGLSRPFASGPRRKDGTMYVSIMVVEKGESKKVIDISCYPHPTEGNKIILDIDGYPKSIVLKYKP